MSSATKPARAKGMLECWQETSPSCARIVRKKSPVPTKKYRQVVNKPRLNRLNSTQRDLNRKMVRTKQTRRKGDDGDQSGRPRLAIRDVEKPDFGSASRSVVERREIQKVVDPKDRTGSRVSYFGK